MQLLAELDKEIKDKKFIELVRSILKKEGQRTGQANQIYFTYFRRMYNLKRMEENSLNRGTGGEPTDAMIHRRLGGFPARCNHLRTAYYAWRVVQ